MDRLLFLFKTVIERVKYDQNWVNEIFVPILNFYVKTLLNCDLP